MNNKQILILNAGSSSIKYRLYKVSDAAIIADGICERIMVDGNFVIKYANQKHEAKANFSDHKIALSYLLNFLEEKKLIANKQDIIGVGHRVVQGGTFFQDSAVIKAAELKVIEDLIPLAPLHNEPQAKIISEIASLLPHAVNVAVFDTSFHQTLKPENKTYAIDTNLAAKYQIQKYGFHGTSYKFITAQMKKILKKESVNLIVCHLGNGSSMAAIEKNLSVNTSMGLTPLEGLVMGTRSGDIDPGVVPYLCKVMNVPASEVDNILNKKSGLLGLSGTSDMRDLIAKINANDPKAVLAMKVFIKHIANYLACYANDLHEKIDGVVFTAGIGENAALVRELVVQAAPLLGLKIDAAANNGPIKDYQLISTRESKYPVYVVRTNEELMIFNDVKRLMN